MEFEHFTKNDDIYIQRLMEDPFITIDELLSEEDADVFKPVEEELVYVSGIGKMRLKDKERIDEWIATHGRYEEKKNKEKSYSTSYPLDTNRWIDVEGFSQVEYRIKNNKIQMRYRGQVNIIPRWHKQEKRYLLWFKEGHGSKALLHRIWMDEILPQHFTKGHKSKLIEV